jgi:hypothetical protein
MPDNHLVIVEDSTAPMRADHLADCSSIATRNAAKRAQGAPDGELEREPPIPSHYRHTLISFKLPLMTTMLDQLGGAWSTQTAKSTAIPLMGKPTGGTTHRLRIDGVVWSVGNDWIVRVASVYASGEQFKGVIMEVKKRNVLLFIMMTNYFQIEYLPVDILPYVEGSSAFLHLFTVSLLPNLPSDANFNSVVITDQEWAHVCGTDTPITPTSSEDDIYVYGDEEEAAVDTSQKGDWRRSAYMIVQAFHGEGIL